MIITDLSINYLDEANALVRMNYEEECSYVPALPTIETFPGLTEFAENGLGVAALENGRLLGYLGCYGIWDNAFGCTGVKGTYSPIHGHSVIKENREMIYKLLYQAAAEKWVNAGILSHAVGLYSHDTHAKNAFFTNGFGSRCVDAIRLMENTEYKPSPGYTCCELAPEDKIQVLPLKNMLTSHLAGSPAFMKFPAMNEDDLQKQFDRRKPRYFVSYKDNKIIAFIEITNNGENFITEESKMQNICGAYCLPEHRGKGINRNILGLVITTLRSEGITRLGVDYESFNPTANSFWPKYFVPYTNSLVRRIDEYILNK